MIIRHTIDQQKKSNVLTKHEQAEQKFHGRKFVFTKSFKRIQNIQ